MSAHFQTNFRKLSQRGSLNTILQSVLQAMNHEFESLIALHSSGQSQFKFQNLVEFRNDLSQACDMICGDILQHFSEFLKVNHPEIPLRDVQAEQRILKEKKVTENIVIQESNTQENLRLNANSAASYEKFTPRERQERSRNGSSRVI